MFYKGTSETLNGLTTVIGAPAPCHNGRDRPTSLNLLKLDYSATGSKDCFGFGVRFHFSCMDYLVVESSTASQSLLHYITFPITGKHSFQ